jgi:hypothetical protein
LVNGQIKNVLRQEQRGRGIAIGGGEVLGERRVKMQVLDQWSSMPPSKVGRERPSIITV